MAVCSEAASALNVASQLRTSVVSDYCEATAAALAIYDYIITFADEVHHIWRREKRGFAFIFLLNRANMWGICISSMMLALQSNYTVPSCGFKQLMWSTCAMVAMLLWAAVSALRVYAVSGRNRWLAAATMLLGVVPFVINAVDTAALRADVISLGGTIMCSYGSTLPRSIQNRYLQLKNEFRGLLTMTC